MEKDINIPVTPPGPNSQKLNERAKEVFNRPWLFNPVWIKKGRGSSIEDVDGNIYLDFMASDYNLGPRHPDIAEKIKEQADKLILTLGASAMWESFLELSERLRTLLPGHLKDGKVFSASGGSEMVELATMLVRSVTRKPLIITYLGGFHGTLPVTVQMTSRQSRFKKGLFPSIVDAIPIPYPYCYRCPFKLKYPECDLQCAEYLNFVLDTAAPPSEVAALLCEVMQVPSGFIIPPKGYWKRIKEICEKNDILTIVDESITCMGRTGTMFAIEHYDFVPDIIVLAKSVAWGAPLSIMVARSDIAKKWDWGMALLTSMGGHPLSSAAALEGLNVMERENVLENVEARGNQFVDGLKELEEKYEIIGDIRSVGLCTGVELVKDKKEKVPATEVAKKISNEAFKRGLIMGTYGIWNNVLRFFPPLIVTKEQINKAVDILNESFKTVLKK